MLISPYHNATVVDFWTPLDKSNNPLFIPVWTYLLTSPITTSISENEKSENINIYPNPASNIINFRGNYEGKIIIYNSVGDVVKIMNLNSGDNIINVSALDKGIYYLKIRGEVRKLIKN
mgnify:FL=1